MTRQFMKPAMRKAVLAAWLDRCAYCRDSEAVAVDHIIPLSRGGSDYPVNYAAACQRCNSRKANGLLADGFLAIILAQAETKAPLVLSNFERFSRPALRRGRVGLIGPRPRKTPEKSAENFTLRVDLELQDAFKAACKANDDTASQVLRAAMRDYLASKSQPALPFSGKRGK